MIRFKKTLGLLEVEKSDIFKSPEIWKKYKSSIEYQNTYQIVQADIEYAKKFFKELYKKTKDFISSNLKKGGD